MSNTNSTDLASLVSGHIALGGTREELASRARLIDANARHHRYDAETVDAYHTQELAEVAMDVGERLTIGTAIGTLWAAWRAELGID